MDRYAATMAFHDPSAATPPPSGRPICIDGRLLVDGGTGVARYAATLIAALAGAGAEPMVLHGGAQAATRSRAARWRAAWRPGLRALERDASGFVRADVFREAQVHFALHRRMLELRAPGPAGVMHWTYPLPMRIAGWRNVYTVHDVIPLDPAIATPVKVPRLRRVLEAVAASADRIVTVSEAARRDIVARLGVDPARVVDCSQAIDITGAGDAPLPAGLAAGGYHLFVGSIEARKNVERLVDAWRASGAGRPLVLAGPDGLGAWRVARAIAGDPRIVRLHYQPRATLLGLIAQARALLFPSLAEGFGLPVAEAMALGTPALTSTGGALEEVAGGAALLVDPHDTPAMARAIRRLDGDDALCARLAAAGRARGAAFAPGPYAERLLSLYGSLP